MISMSNISFQSRIKFVNKEDFKKIVSSHGKQNAVCYPWTVNESLVAKEAYTEGVFDCTVCGITDGLKVLLMHICPTRKENQDFSKITEFMKNKLDLFNSNKHGFLLGSKDIKFLGEDSLILFDNFEKFFQENQISYSKIKGGMSINDVAYSSKKDEWLVSHDFYDSKRCKRLFKTPLNYLKNKYDEVEISSLDKLSW